MTLNDTGNINWLASYPKSGNTWLRIFLSYILSPDKNTFDISNLSIKSIASSRQLFDHFTGLDSCNLTPDEIDILRPELYRYISDNKPTLHHLKVHDAYRNTSNKQALFPKQASKRVIYIIRNPLDVAVSFKYHMGYEDISESVRDMCASEGGLALANHKMPGQLPQYMGSWSNHVISWTKQAHIPVTVVRYEDMLLDSLNTFRQLLNTLNINKPDCEIQEAIDATHFQKLQQYEINKGFQEKPTLMPNFFRKGKIGDWKNELNESDITKIIECNQLVMKNFGYIDTKHKPTF